MKLLRQHAVTLVLVVAAILLAVVVIWDRSRVSTTESKAREDLLLDAWRGDQLGAVRVRRPTGSIEVQIGRSSDGSRRYRLREDGQEVDADDQAIDGYLSTLELAGYLRDVSSLDRQALGVADTSPRIEVDMGELHYRIRLGAGAPSPPGARYLEVEGGGRGRVSFVVGKQLAKELALEPGSLRARNVLPYLSVGVARYEIRGPEGQFTLRRGGWGGRTAGAFLLDAPPPIGIIRADRRVLDGWLSALGRLEVERFITVPKTDAPEATHLRLVPRQAGAPAGELVVGGACPNGMVRVVRRTPPPAAGCVTDKRARAVVIDAERLVDRHVVGTAISDMVELQLSAEAARVDMARQGDGWHLRKPTDATVPPAAARALLEALGALEGQIASTEQRGDPAQMGIDPPQGRLVIRGAAERGGDRHAGRIERIDVGHERDGMVLVRRQDDHIVLAVAASAADVLLPHPGLLRPAVIYDEPLNQVRALELDCDHRHQRLLRDARGRWTLAEPQRSDVGADGGLAGQLVERIRKLRAVRWAAERPGERHGLEAPWCRIALTLAPPLADAGAARKLQLLLGAAAPGGTFAQHDDEPAVFVAPRALGVGARRWLLDRGALRVADEGLERVVLRGEHGAALQVRVESDHWRVVGQQQSEAGQQLRTALEGLMAEGVVHLGAAREREGLAKPRLTIEVYRRGSPDPPLRIEVGAGEVFEDTSIYFVRRSDLDATFAVAQSRIRLLGALL